MKRITTYIENGRSFEICKADEAGEAAGYWAFEDKFIGADGSLLKEFNGISGHHSQSLAETIEKVSNMVKVDALVDAGMDRFEAAFLVVCGIKK